MTVPQVITAVGEATDPAVRLRHEWAESLDEHLKTTGVSRKQLQQLLANAGQTVSLQAIGLWLRGETSPRPVIQRAIAQVLHVPVRRLFPIDTP